MLHFDLLSRDESSSTAPRHLGRISPFSFSSPFTPRSLKDSLSNEHVVSGREAAVQDKTERPIVTTAIDSSSRNSSSNDATPINNGDKTMTTNNTSLEVSFPRRTNTVIPTITVGRVYSSIRPYKSSTRRQHDWHAEDDLDVYEEDVGALSLASALVVAMESSRDDAAGFWKLSSVTDPITAMGLMRGGKVPSGQRALFVEREVAEGIARGKLQMKEPENKGTKDRSAVWKRLLKPLEFFQEAVLSGNARRKGSPAVTDLERQKSDRSAIEGINASRPLTFELRTTAAGRSYDHRTGPKHRRSSGLKGREEILRARSKRLLGDSISQEDAVSLSGKAAALAGVPTRIALELLKHMPGEFVLLSRYIGRTERSQGRRADAKLRDRPAASGLSRLSGIDCAGENDDDDDDAASRSETTRIRDGKREAYVPSNNDAGRMATGVLTGAEHLSAVMVHTLNGFEVVQQTGEDGKVCRFIPAFLSRSSLEDFWYAMSTLVRTNALRRRRAQRRASNELLIAKLAALAASSGIGNGGESNAGGGASGFGVGNGEDSDVEGFEDPAEVQEVIREIQGGLDMAGNESGSDDRSTRGGLVRGAATLACGIFSLMGPIIEGIGALTDATLLCIPGGTRVLGIPELLDEVQSKPLRCLLVDCQKHNDSMLESKLSQGSGGGDARDRYNEMLSTAAMWSAVIVKLSLDQLLLLQSVSMQRGNTGRRTKLLERADGGNGGSRSGWQGLLTPPSSKYPFNGIMGGVLPVEVPASKSMPGEPPISSASPVGESPASLAGRESVAFFLSRFLPSLEYNGFSHLVPSHADYQKRKKALMDLAPDDGTMNLGIQLAVSDDNEQAVQRSSSETDIANDEKSLPSTGLKNGKNGGGDVRGTNHSDSSTEATAEKGGSQSSNSNALKSLASLEYSKKQYADGKGIILIGCCETSTAQAPKPSTPGTWWVKEGVEVGIVDGAQYIVG